MRVNGLNAWLSAIVVGCAVLCEDAAFRDTFLRGSITRGEVKRRVRIAENLKEETATTGSRNISDRANTLDSKVNFVDTRDCW